MDEAWTSRCVQRSRRNAALSPQRAPRIPADWKPTLASSIQVGLSEIFCIRCASQSLAVDEGSSSQGWPQEAQGRPIRVCHREVTSSESVWLSVSVNSRDERAVCTGELACNEQLACKIRKHCDLRGRVKMVSKEGNAPTRSWRSLARAAN